MAYQSKTKEAVKKILEIVVFKSKTMTTKSERRTSYENRVDQDGRLAGKHIKTLLHLQDLHSENDLLKARIAELELQNAKTARCDLLEREVEKLRVREMIT